MNLNFLLLDSLSASIPKLLELQFSVLYQALILQKISWLLVIYHAMPRVSQINKISLWPLPLELLIQKNCWYCTSWDLSVGRWQVRRAEKMSRIWSLKSFQLQNFQGTFIENKWFLQEYIHLSLYFGFCSGRSVLGFSGILSPKGTVKTVLKKDQTVSISPSLSSLKNFIIVL